MADQLKVAQTTSHCSDKTRNLFDSSNITKITQYNTLHVVYVRRLIICPRLHQQHIDVSKRLPLASSPKYFNQSPNRRERERERRKKRDLCFQHRKVPMQKHIQQSPPVSKEIGSIFHPPPSSSILLHRIYLSLPSSALSSALSYPLPIAPLRLVDWI